MPNIPAYCLNCNNFVPSGFALATGGAVTMEGNMSQCPLCGGRAFLMDGLYEAAANALKLIAAPGTTQGQIERLGEALNRARNEGMSPEATIDLVEKEAPELAPSLLHNYETALKDPHYHAKLMIILLTALGLILTQCGARGLQEANEPIGEVNVEQVLDATVDELVASPGAGH